MRRGLVYLMTVTSLILATGCFKTTYVNLYANDYSIPEDSNPTRERVSGWQHFFVFGLAPGEKYIDSTEICGEGYIKEIHTRWTFAQGLIYVFTSYYINIYAPYTGKTICVREIRKS